MESSVKPFLCDFCGRGFKRGLSDALKRHSRTCKVRQSAHLEVQYVPNKIRGKKPQACDRCARLRRACTSTQPCKTCVARRLACTYKRMRRSQDVDLVQQQPQEATFTQLDFSLTSEPAEFIALNDVNVANALDLSAVLSPFEPIKSTDEHINHFNMSYVAPNMSPWPEPEVLATWQLLHPSLGPGLLFPRPTDFNLEALKTFPFLAKLTSVHGLGNTFECGDLSQRFIITRGPISPSTGYVEHLDASSNLLPSVVDSYNVESSTVIPSEFLNKSEEVIAAVLQGEAYYKSARRCIDSWSFPLEKVYCRLFSPEHLQRYLSLYWSCWHPNWPVMHKPSFSVTETSPVLVAAMAVIGACLSTTQDDCALAKLAFDTVEELVFNDEVFSDDRLPTSTEDRSSTNLKSQLELLLAAYCVCLYQTWEGSRISKRRARRLRYNQIIGLLRDIRADSATLRDIDTTQFSAFDWREFALRESLARTFAYIHNLDCGYAMFYQEPVRISVPELCFDLSTPETCFAAESAEDCFALLKVWRDTLQPHRNISVSFALTTMCSPNCPATVERMVSRLSVLSMFTLISALYKLANQLENSLLYSVLSPALKHGLSHWSRLWPSEHRDFELLDTFADSSGLRLPCVGFQRYAPEYWLYTYLTLQRARQRSHWDDGLDDEGINYDDNDMKRCRRLLREFGTMEAGAP